MKGIFILNLAIKNLARYKRRTFITVIVLAIGIACFILLDSMLIWAREDSEINLIRYETGSAKLVTPAYWADWKDFPLKESVENPGAVIAELKNKGIDAVLRTSFDTMVTTSAGLGGSFPALVTGVDMEKDSEVFELLETVEQGRLPLPDEDAVIMGSWMAVDLQLQIGDLLVLQVVDRAGGHDAIEVEIVGLVDSPNPIVNMMGLYLPMKTLDYYLYMEGSATEIVMKLPYGPGESRGLDQAAQVAEQFGLELHPWQDWAKEYVAASEGDKYGSFVILMLIFIIAAVGFSNTLLMSLLERVPETGMMRALGSTRREMRRLFLTESLILGLLGSLMGMVFGALGNIPMVQKGIDITPMMRDMGNIGYRFTGIMYGVWSPSSFFVAFTSGIIIALAVSFVSIQKTLKLKITDSVRAV